MFDVEFTPRLDLPWKRMNTERLLSAIWQPPGGLMVGF
jgi:hypothetical protein